MTRRTDFDFLKIPLIPMLHASDTLIVTFRTLKDNTAVDKESADLSKLVDLSDSCKFMMVPEKALAGNAKFWP